jgi:hypothetical protein
VQAQQHTFKKEITMATDSKNLIEEIIDNAIDPSTHLVPEDEGTSDKDITKRIPHDPLNENLVPDPDQP